ncbi:MAG TPA: trypsin-like peptidase domain-containing protein, partial [Caldimonas sp.]|nr:trypsin-like peptidase domain-containing protein [Caldimonas sp.]
MATIAGAAAAQTLNTTQLYTTLEPSVWVVRTFDKDNLPLGQGSAVVVAADALATNCHVLRKAKRVEVTHRKVVLAATLELWDTARDLCQLRAPGTQAPAVALADDG